MFDNEMSVEALYAHATGLENSKPDTFLVSTEAFDGYYDNLSVEMQSAENALDFTDTYSLIEQKNASDKIRMLKKIKANYGGNNSGAASIESFCNVKSMEAEEAAADAGTDANPKSAGDTAKKQSKIGKFFSVIFKGIAKFFKKIWDFLKGLVQKFIGLFKKKKEETVKEEKTGVDQVELDQDKSKNSASSSGNADGFNVTLNNFEKSGVMILDWRVPINLGGMNKFCQAYKNYGKSYEALQKKMMSSILTSTASSAAETISKTGDIDKGLSKFDDDSTMNGEMHKFLSQNRGDFEKMYEGSRSIATMVPGLVSKSSGQSLGAHGSNTMSVKQYQKWFDNVTNGIKFDKQGNRDAAYEAVKFLTGIPRFASKKEREWDAVRGGAIHASNKLSMDLDQMIKTLNPTHEMLLKASEEINSKLEKDFSSAKANDNTKLQAWRESLGFLASGLKLATKCESAVAQITSAITQSGIKFAYMKFDQSAANGTNNKNKK